MPLEEITEMDCCILSLNNQSLQKNKKKNWPASSPPGNSAWSNIDVMPPGTCFLIPWQRLMLPELMKGSFFQGGLFQIGLSNFPKNSQKLLFPIKSYFTQCKKGRRVLLLTARHCAHFARCLPLQDCCQPNIWQLEPDRLWQNGKLQRKREYIWRLDSTPALQIVAAYSGRE